MLHLCPRKLHQRLDLMCHATSVAGGVYMYANQRGCDGGRLYYDGSACIICNGQLLAQARTTSSTPCVRLQCCLADGSFHDCPGPTLHLQGDIWTGQWPCGSLWTLRDD